MTVVNFRTYVAPNGVSKVKIFPHGYIEFPDDMKKRTKELIRDCSAIAVQRFGKNLTPYEIFEKMGWTEESLRASQQNEMKLSEKEK